MFAAPATAASSRDSDSLTIDVKARIDEQCGIVASGPTSNNGADLSVATTVNYGFTLNCNTPFKIGVSSEHGGLRLTTAASDAVADNGFSVEKPYDVRLRVRTDGEAMQPDDCSSEALVDRTGDCAFFGRNPGQGLSSGQRTAINREGTLRVSWPAESNGGPRRVAGLYQDTLTVVVGARD